jgi:hypothetical protein
MLSNHHFSDFFGLFLILGTMLTGCGASSPPTYTPVLLYVTTTPTPAHAASRSPSVPDIGTATLVQSPATPTPTSIVAATSTNTATPDPPTPTPAPHAIINSPQEVLNVRSGPGLVYDPPVGAYNNGAVVDVIGKQYSPEGELWWLIPFAGTASGQGWIYAEHTTAYKVEDVPWVAPPPLPSPTPTPTATPLPPPQAIIDSPDGFTYVRNGPGFIYEPPLGTLQNGFMVNVLGKQRSTEDEIWWLIPFSGTATGQGWIYAKHTFTRYVENVPWLTPPSAPTGLPLTPPIITPTMTTAPTAPPVVDWIISGRISRTGTTLPISKAQVEAFLGSETGRLTAVTDINGNFAISGSAPDVGTLKINVSAPGYRPNSFIFTQTTSRSYELPNIQLSPLNENCRYESVLDVPQSSGISRLQSLGFTTIITAAIGVIDNQAVVDLILTQEPEPPRPDQLVNLECTMPIKLGVGVERRIQ